MKHVSSIRKANYYVGLPGSDWHIVATFEAYGFRIGITADGLIKDIAKVTYLNKPLEDGSGSVLEFFSLENSDKYNVSEEVFSYNSYRGEKWKQILKIAEEQNIS